MSPITNKETVGDKSFRLVFHTAKPHQNYISPQEDDVLLEQAKKESIETAKEQEKIGPRTIAGFNLKDVNDDGNCFYLAVVDQLALIDHPFMHGIPEGTTSNDSLWLFIQGEAFRDREWAGNKEIEILAQKLNLIVAIVDTRTPQAGLYPSHLKMRTRVSARFENYR